MYKRYQKSIYYYLQMIREKEVRGCFVVHFNVVVPSSRSEKLARALTEEGDLDGLLLTGISEEGLTLLQHFVDKSGDVQSAALAVSVAAAAGSAANSSDERFIGWCQAYR